MPVLEKPPAGGESEMQVKSMPKFVDDAWILKLTKEDQKLSTAVKVIYE